MLVKPYDIYLKGDPTSTISYTKDELEGSEFRSLCKKNGYTYEFTVKGQQSGLGETQSVISSFTLYDADGNDITDQYNFNFKAGKLQVYMQEISVITDSRTFYYDGKVKNITQDEQGIYSIVYGEEGSLMEGHSISKLEINVSIKDVGSIQNKIDDFVISDSYGNNVTSFYKINFVYGKTTVKAREITVETHSKDVTYESLGGGMLICHECTVTSDMEGIDEALAEGDKIVPTYTAKLTRPGRVTNKATVKIYDAFGKDVTSNYSITLKFGTLRILR